MSSRSGRGGKTRARKPANRPAPTTPRGTGQQTRPPAATGPAVTGPAASGPATDTAPTATDAAPGGAAGTVTAAPRTAGQLNVKNRPNLVAVGTVIWLLAELMFFTGLFAIFFTARAVTVGAWPPDGFPLDLTYGIALTAVLLVSSGVCHLGVVAVTRADPAGLRRWFFVTAALGVLFLIGLGNLYRVVVQSGNTLDTSAFAGVFFLLTAFHALHVIGGIVALGRLATKATSATIEAPFMKSSLVVSYFWHFVNVTWIAVFASVYILR